MLEKLIDPISNILDKFVADKDLKAKLQHELDQELHKANMAQIEVNKEQAKHSSLFVSGARPAIMWVCCLGLLLAVFVGPILTWATGIWFPEVIPPQLEVEGLITLVNVTFRTWSNEVFEKSKNVARDNLK